MTVKTISDAVRELNGHLPPGDGNYLYYHRSKTGGHYLRAYFSSCVSCQPVGTVAEFNQEANRPPRVDSPEKGVTYLCKTLEWKDWYYGVVLEDGSVATRAQTGNSPWRVYEPGRRDFVFKPAPDDAPRFRACTHRQQDWVQEGGWPPLGTHCRVTWGTKGRVHECFVVTEDLLFTRLPDDTGPLGHWAQRRRNDLPYVEFRPLIESERECWIRQAVPYVRNAQGVCLTPATSTTIAEEFYDALTIGDLPVPKGDDH